jgi:hypothetical protein
MKIVLGGGIVILVVLAGVLAHAVEPLVLYDDFNAAELDAGKWVKEEEGAGTKPIVQLQDNRLQLFNRSYGKTDSDKGQDGGGLFLSFPKLAAVTAIKATIQVKDVGTTGCPGNSEATRVSTFLGGPFFSAATPPPGSVLRNVWALIGIVRGSDMTTLTEVLSVVSRVGHCTNADCKESTWLHSRYLGSIKRGEMATLRLQRDQDNHRFIFQRDDDPEIFVPYTLADTAPPWGRRKGLRIVYGAANCTTIRSEAFMETLFGDVFVNESAVSVAGQ